MAIQISAKAAGLVLAAAVAGVWFGASITDNAVREQNARASSGARPLGSSPIVAPKTEALRRRVTEPPSPARGRNPFTYAPRSAPRSAPRDASREAAAMAAPLLAVPTGPTFRLSGIASETKDGETIFTAILNDNGAITFAKAGEKLSNGYSVVRVEEMSITVVDADGVTQTIRLP